MNSLHSFGNAFAMEREDGLTNDLDLREALFDRELFPAPAFFTERVFMRREPERPFHSASILAPTDTSGDDRERDRAACHPIRM